MRRRQSGYLLAEMAIAVAVIGTVAWAGNWWMDAQIEEAFDDATLAIGNGLREYNAALGAYQTQYFQNLLLDKDVVRCQVDPQNRPIDAAGQVTDGLNCAPQLDASGQPVRLLAGTGETKRPSQAKLQALGLLRSDFPATWRMPHYLVDMPFESVIRKTPACPDPVPPGTTLPSGCGLESFAWLPAQVVQEANNAQLDLRRIGWVVRKLGHLAASNTTAGDLKRFTGLDDRVVVDGKTWPELRPFTFYAGFLGMRNGYASQGYSEFLRRDGTLEMTGDLNVGGHRVVNVGGIEFAETFTPRIGEPCNLNSIDAATRLVIDPPTGPDTRERKQRRFMAKPGTIGSIQLDKPTAAANQNYASGMLLACSYDQNRTTDPSKPQFSWLKATGGVSGQEEAIAGMMDGYETNANYSCWPDNIPGGGAASQVSTNFSSSIPSHGIPFWNQNPNNPYNMNYGLSYLKALMMGGKVLMYARQVQPQYGGGSMNRWILAGIGEGYDPTSDYTFFTTASNGAVPVAIPAYDNQIGTWTCRVPGYLNRITGKIEGDPQMSAFSSFWFGPNGVFYSAGGTRWITANKGTQNTPEFSKQETLSEVPYQVNADDASKSSLKVTVPVTHCSSNSVNGINYVESCTTGNTEVSVRGQYRDQTTDRVDTSGNVKPVWYQTPISVTQTFSWRRKTTCTDASGKPYDWSLAPSLTRRAPSIIYCQPGFD
ncbi:hypothetical protein [Parachitinimonas caeni]|uniref:Shufflon system plasmid conjugative transfer pilus tip adhesin PilV n=1 Tax=Parachitinimonas caeni TaxID=3031301 RepID=A0ABT7E325_9NEIS|nr:hypothetical protein [Parachitinimonas caeni]MDK2126710.1 hypothetical protein [Parachitinimonas caeni]